MGILRLFRPAKRLANISVYYMSAIVDGDVKASPIGIIPRFSAAYEKTIREAHRPAGTCYVNETIEGVSVIFYWAADKIEAVSFLSADDARAFPGFREIPEADLAVLDRGLAHFPR